MPIEIRELVIRATVEPGGGTGAGQAPSRPGHAPPQHEAHSREDLVQACVREVLRVLEDKRER